MVRLDVKDGKLVCDRNEHFELKLWPEEQERAGRAAMSGGCDDGRISWVTSGRGRKYYRPLFRRRERTYDKNVCISSKHAATT